MAVHFAAEVSSNHNRSLERCLDFVDRAADIGCSSVKFQLFKIERLFTPEVIASRPDIRGRREWELPLSFLEPLAGRCRKRQVEFGCTPFYLEAVEELYPFVDYYKVASYELLWTDLVRECAATDKPLVLSTGMATLGEVEAAVVAAREAGRGALSLLHCTSAYPAEPRHCNLGAIETLRTAFGLPVGWSDHSVDSGVIYRAVHRFGASMVEFHLDLEGAGEEFTGGHCWLPEQIGAVIKGVGRGLAADGNARKWPAESETVERLWRADPRDGLRPLKETRENN